MKVISKPGAINLTKTAIAIGIFDGVHKGHQLVIKSMVDHARTIKAKAGIVTFFPHPVHVLRPSLSLPYLISLNHRLLLFKELNVDFVYIIKFDQKFSRIDPVSFIKNILVDKLHAKSVYVGDNFRFGKDRSGDINLFKRLAPGCGYSMKAVSIVKQGKEAISSGRLRKLIPEGKLKEAEKLLGRPVSVLGKVVRGASRGRLLGFPTANVAYECDALPPLGVYAVRVTIKDKVYFGMANLGVRPSFKEKKPRVHLEVNIFNFSRSIYNQDILVEFLRKTREEKKFSSKEALIEQIKKDEVTIRRLLKVE